MVRIYLIVNAVSGRLYDEQKMMELGATDSGVVLKRRTRVAHQNNLPLILVP
jgi:hypothetical protein